MPHSKDFFSSNSHCNSSLSVFRRNLSKQLTMKMSTLSPQPLVEAMWSVRAPLVWNSRWNPKTVWSQMRIFMKANRAMVSSFSVKTLMTARWVWSLFSTTRLLILMRNGNNKTLRWKTELLVTFHRTSSMFSRMSGSRHQSPTAIKCNLFRCMRAASLVMKTNKKWSLVKI